MLSISRARAAADAEAPPGSAADAVPATAQREHRRRKGEPRHGSNEGHQLHLMQPESAAVRRLVLCSFWPLSPAVLLVLELASMTPEATAVWWQDSECECELWQALQQVVPKPDLFDSPDLPGVFELVP